MTLKVSPLPEDADALIAFAEAIATVLSEKKELKKKISQNSRFRGEGRSPFSSRWSATIEVSRCRAHASRDSNGRYVVSIPVVSRGR
jgi:hypothetical protein